MPSTKYFLDPKGVPTMRLAGKAGGGHIEIAMATEKLDPNGDIYHQMFALGFVRLFETEGQVHVDAPRALTGGQRRFLDGKEKDGKRIIVNSDWFVSNRGKRGNGSK